MNTLYPRTEYIKFSKNSLNPRWLLTLRLLDRGQRSLHR
jgi:hypothetical protein